MHVALTLRCHLFISSFACHVGQPPSDVQTHRYHASCDQSWRQLGSLKMLRLQVMDALVVSLAKWTVLLDPQAQKPSVAFGDNAKACLATEAVFALANRCARPAAGGANPSQVTISTSGLYAPICPVLPQQQQCRTPLTYSLQAINAASSQMCTDQGPALLSGLQMPDSKAQLTQGLQAHLTAAGRFGDSLRAGWRNILDCVTRIYSLGLLPGSVVAMEGEDVTAANSRMPRPSAARRSNTASSIISRAFSRCIRLAWIHSP